MILLKYVILSTTLFVLAFKNFNNGLHLQTHTDAGAYENLPVEPDSSEGAYGALESCDV